MKKLNVMFLILGLGFLAYLVSRIGARELWRELCSLGWGMLPFVLCEGVAEMIHTRGWRRCLSGPYRAMSWTHLFKIRMAGYAINYLTPTAALGGEVTRAALLSSSHPGPGAASGVLIEKVCFSLAHVVFVALGSLLVLWQVHLPRALWTLMALSAILVAGGVVTFLLLQKRGKLGGLIRWAAARKTASPTLKKVTASITGVDESLSAFYREQPVDLWRAVAWHLMGYSIGIGQTWFFFHLLRQATPLRVAAAIWLLGMWFDLVAFFVPMNAGSLEGSRIVAMAAFGYSAVLGMTYGVALRLAQIFWACFGLVIYAALLKGKSHSEVKDSSANFERTRVKSRVAAYFKAVLPRASNKKSISNVTKAISPAPEER